MTARRSRRIARAAVDFVTCLAWVATLAAVLPAEGDALSPRTERARRWV